MEWYVYVFDINKQKIEKYNIFDHYSFRQSVFNLFYGDNGEGINYEEELDKILKYYFWSKAEWEIVISPWAGGKIEQCEIKIDIYSQIKMNWEVFFNMVMAEFSYEDDWDFEEWDEDDWK